MRKIGLIVALVVLLIIPAKRELLGKTRSYSRSCGSPYSGSSSRGSYTGRSGCSRPYSGAPRPRSFKGHDSCVGGYSGSPRPKSFNGYMGCARPYSGMPRSRSFKGHTSCPRKYSGAPGPRCYSGYHRCPRTYHEYLRCPVYCDEPEPCCCYDCYCDDDCYDCTPVDYSYTVGKQEKGELTEAINDVVNSEGSGLQKAVDKLMDVIY